MNFETYGYLLGLIVDDIKKEDTTMCKAIPAGACLAVTLCYLAHGVYLCVLIIYCFILPYNQNKSIKKYVINIGCVCKYDHNYVLISFIQRIHTK